MVLIIKRGYGRVLSRWENPARAIPPRTPPRNPPQTAPNQAEPYKGSEPLLARRPYVARGTVLISEIKKKNQNPKLSNSLNRSLRSTHTQDLLPTAQHHHTHEPTHVHPQEEE